MGENGAVAHLRLIEVDEATGQLRVEYDAAIGRAGKVFNIVKAMSLRPEVLREAMGLYRAIMFGPSELARTERELLAVVVSNANDCHY
jgi:alkylhydroperoxidase family enzyme